MKILLLDDSEVSRHVIAGALEGLGVEVLTAEDVKDAVTFIAYCGHPLANMGIAPWQVKPDMIPKDPEKWQSSGKRKMPKLK